MTPLLTATPSDPVTYNVGIAETFSWIPVGGAGRPLYAQAVYLVNGTGGGGGGGGGVSSVVDITNPGTASTLLNSIISKLNQQLGQNGFDFIEAGALKTGNWTTITVATSTARFSVINATGSVVTNMTNYDFPITFTMSGPFTAIQLADGAVIAYK